MIEEGAMPTAPKSPEQRRRRNATLPMTKLPTEGRTGDLPPWPLTGMSNAEADLWADLWTRPQAVVWEMQHLTRIVARYCRLTIAAEQVDAPMTAAGECRQLEDRLLLTPIALKRAYYEIAADDLGEARDARNAPAEPKPRRLVAVDTAAS